MDDRIIPANIPNMENASESIKNKYQLQFSCVEYPLVLRNGNKTNKGIYFHPLVKDGLDFFMYGKNKIHTVLMSERLIKILHKHGVK